MEDLTKRSTEEVLRHHLKHVQSCNLEEALLDYTEQSTLINFSGPKHGLEEIRAFFADSMKTCLPPESVWVNETTYVDGEMAYTIWTAESPFYSIPYGTDTYIIRGGKIIQQTFAGILKEKPAEGGEAP